MTTDAEPLPSALTVGLRFQRRDAEKLRAIADRAIIHDLQADVQLYRDAAECAERGDPFHVTALDRDDLYILIAGLVAHGVDQPTIDEARIG